MPDRREEILTHEFEKYKSAHPAENWATIDEIKNDGTVQIVFNAMDENGRQMCLELLKYVAKKVSNFWIDDNGEAKFRLSGDEELTAKQLFENFL